MRRSSPIRAWPGLVILIVSLLAGGCGRAAPTAHSRFIFLPPMDGGGSSGRHAVTICLPAGYEATDRRYPVIYLLDGETAFFTREHGPGDAIGYEVAHDQLVHDGLIQPAILVAIDNGTDSQGGQVRGSRGIDYYPNLAARAGRGEAYFDFLAGSLKPMIDRTYRTKPESASTGVAGFSASGMGAFWMTYAHPEVFGMGLCQSPDLRLVDELIAGHQGPIPPVRLWLDAGSREIEIGLLKSTWAVSRALVAQGFRQNVDLAFQIGHDHGHEKFCCHQRMRAALYFLLRTRAPTFTGAEVVELDARAGGAIDLARVGMACLETVWDGWFRLCDCTATFAIADPAIVGLADELNRLTPLAPGETTITARADGHDYAQRIRVPAPMDPLACAAPVAPVTVDGDLGEWPAFPLHVAAPRAIDATSAWTGAADLSYSFACAHDEGFLYIAIRATDDLVRSAADAFPWVQDGVEVRVDARPGAARLAPALAKEFEDILLVAASPAHPGEARRAFLAEKLPPGTVVVCTATPTGHDTEIAIPGDWLDAKAGGAWRDVRINIVVNDLDDGTRGARPTKVWWQGDWRTPDIAWGSGTFARTPASPEPASSAP
jgi:predicted alpha/beta superfamily hydrolase